MLKSKNIYIRPFTEDDAESLFNLQRENRYFFERISYERTDDFYTIIAQQSRIREFAKDWENDQAYTFGIFTKGDTLIGTINLFQVLRGSL